MSKFDKKTTKFCKAIIFQQKSQLEKSIGDKH